MKFTFDDYPDHHVRIRANPYGGLYYEVRTNLGHEITSDYKGTPHWTPDWYIRRSAKRSLRKALKERKKLNRFRDDDTLDPMPIPLTAFTQAVPSTQAAEELDRLLAELIAQDRQKPTPTIEED